MPADSDSEVAVSVAARDAPADALSTAAMA
jgi:hypothetical protein